MGWGDVAGSSEGRSERLHLARGVRLAHKADTIVGMSAPPPYDPRGVANLLLDIIEQKDGRRATHIDLQKLIYFAHGRYLIGSGAPLVSGYFEAWQWGPVHPTIYHCFKPARNQPITFRAEQVNLVTGDRSIVPSPDSALVREYLDQTAISYARLSTGQLIKISHAAEAPWDLTVRRTNNAISLGMRISNEVIVSAFRKHKVTVGPGGSAGDDLVDTPYTRD